MLLLGALFALFIVGFWLYCLVDVALTPSNECRRLPKAGWIAVVAGTFVIGAVAWLAVRRPAQPTVASLSPGSAAGPGGTSGADEASRGGSQGDAAQGPGPTGGAAFSGLAKIFKRSDWRPIVPWPRGASLSSRLSPAEPGADLAAG
jgi:hypothetical protein